MDGWLPPCRVDRLRHANEILGSTHSPKYGSLCRWCGLSMLQGMQVQVQGAGAGWKTRWPRVGICSVLWLSMTIVESYIRTSVTEHGYLRSISYS